MPISPVKEIPSPEQMPPPETKKTLTKEEVATLRKWIDQGAEYQLHWSFIPPEKAEVPAVQNQEWVRNPIDRFSSRIIASLPSCYWRSRSE